MMFDNKAISLLIVEDNIGDYLLLKELLNVMPIKIDFVAHVTTMGEVESLIHSKSFDIALLDLTLPDSQYTDSVIRLTTLLPQIPIIIFSGLADIELAKNTISLGAQDYLVKGEFNDLLLFKTIQYSIERKKIQQAIKLSLDRYEFVIDNVTHDIIWEWDIINDTTIYGNSINQILNYTTKDKNQSLDWMLKKIHPEDRERVTKTIKNCFNTNIEKWQDEYRILGADNNYRIIFNRGFVLYNEQNEPYLMIGAMTDITERKSLENRLFHQKINQQKLIIELSIQAQENEKNNLASELHDNVNQILAVAKIYLKMAIDQKELPDEIDLVKKSHQFVTDAIEELRKISHSLYSPTLGNIKLQDALQRLSYELNNAKEFTVELIQDGDHNILVDEKKSLCLYRIAQEQINNIIKYSKAKHVTIKLSITNKCIQLSIVDDGVGFEKHTSMGIGLKNIQQRVQFYEGDFSISSAPGKGCTLIVSIPLRDLPILTNGL